MNPEESAKDRAEAQARNKEKEPINKPKKENKK